MARRKPSQPLDWNVVNDEGGALLGHWAITSKDHMTVRRADGLSKRVRTSIGGFSGNQGLARLVLSEPFP